MVGFFANLRAAENGTETTAIAGSRDDPDGVERVARALRDVEDAIVAIGPDPDLEEIRALLVRYLDQL